MRINIVHMGFFYSGGGEGLLSQEGRDSAETRRFFLGDSEVFGPGALVIERLILKKLCSKRNVNYENVKDNEFQSAVKEVKKRSTGPM